MLVYFRGKPTFFFLILLLLNKTLQLLTLITVLVQL